MITLKRLTWSNMFSYGEGNYIDFDKKVLQLQGKNGAGKSSIPAVLEEVLYNKNSRGFKKAEILNRHAKTKSYSASCLFVAGDDEYLVTKNVASTASVKLTKNGKDISGHTATQTYEIIESVIGLDFNTFTKLVYQSMVSSLDFLTATDAVRKKFLISLLGLEKYSDAQVKIKEAVSSHKQVLASAEGRVSYLVKNTEGYVEEDYKLVIPEYVFSKQDSIRNEIAALNAKIKSCEDDNKYVLYRQNVKNRLDSRVVTPVKEPVLPKNHFDFELTFLQVGVQNAQKELKDLSEQKTKCPTCGKAYDGDFSHRDAQMAQLNQRINTDLPKINAIKIEQSALATEHKNYEKYLADLAELERDKKAFDESFDSSKPTKVMDVDSIAKSIKVLQAELEEGLSKERSVNAERNAAMVFNAKLEAAKETHAKLKSDLCMAMTEATKATDKSVKLGILNDAFGTKGLISYKIESLVKVFEGLINEYLQVLSDGKFVLTFVVEDTKLALKLYDDGQEISIVALSSGEFNKVNTATLLAVRRMMTSLSKVDINVLFLDEVVSVLDAEGRDTLVEVLLNEPFMNTIVVSHGYSHPLADTLTVIKEGKISRLLHDK